MHGKRLYGRVDAHGGEHAETLFAHAYLMPIAPRGSVWIMREDGVDRTGFPIAPCRRSIAATYLRWWGPVVAVLALAAPLAIGGPIALVASALVAWAWTWRTLRGSLARRRSDWNLCAYRTRCDPRLIAGDDRVRLEARLTAHWREHGFERTPEQVARHGPTSAAQALLAYGLLRLHAEDALADRLVLARHEPAGVARIVDVTADVAAAARAWHRCAPAERDGFPGRDWADLLATDDAFADALADARHESATRGRAREAIDAALGRARDQRIGGLFLALAAAVFAAAAWLVAGASDRASLAVAAVASAGAATVLAALGHRGRRRARAALAALAAADAESTN